MSATRIFFSANQEVLPAFLDIESKKECYYIEQELTEDQREELKQMDAEDFLLGLKLDGIKPGSNPGGSPND